MAEEKSAVHEGHRKRLKEKFLSVGADELADHELVELLLYYAIPRKNTNEIAHDLINEFGTLSEIFDADVESIEKIEEVTRHTAIMFKLMSACVKRYINDRNNIANVRLTPMNIDTYIKNLFYGHTREIAYVVFLDSKCIVRKVKKLSSGTINETPFYPREIVTLAVNERFPYMIIAHNHPSGNAIPSESDLRITKVIEQALSFVEVRLVDHVVVSGEEVTSIARCFNIFDKE